MSRRSVLIASFALSTLTLACSEKKPEAPAAPAPSALEPAAPAPAPAAPAEAAQPAAAAPAADPVAEAAEIFKTRCSTCHGLEGKGDGAAAAALNPKPRTFTDKEWQKSVTDEHIEKIIVGGGASVGKSALMPPNPDLADKKEVVAALRATVRKLGE